MKRKNKTQFVLLGILAQKSSTGYDIKKYIDVSMSTFWNESFGQLYPNLKELVKQKLATVNVSKTKSKQIQKTYSITEEGKKLLRIWLNEIDYEMPLVRNELLLKLFFSMGIDDTIILNRIQHYKELILKHVEDLQAKARKYRQSSLNSKIQRNWVLAIDHEIYIAEAQLRWIEQANAMLERTL
jgi:PadR family transcriptional regulator, regulatory protein AphA